MTCTPPVRRPTLVAIVATLLVLAGTGGTAWAHGDGGELSITKVEQVAPLEVTVEVGIVYANDGHLAEDATVSATLTAADGTQVGPTALARTGPTTSLYSARVAVPAAGDWSVRVESTEPEGAAEGAVSVTDEATASPSTEPPSTEPPSTSADEPADDQRDGAAADAQTAISPTAASDVVGDGGSDTALIAGLAALAFVAVAGGVAWVVRRRSSTA